MVTSIENLVIENLNSTVRFIEEDTIFIFYKKRGLIELSDFHESRAAYLKMADGKMQKLMIEFPLHSEITAEARNFLEINAFKKRAEAIILHSLAQRIISRVYILMRKNDHPTRIFTCREKALIWLRNC